MRIAAPLLLVTIVLAGCGSSGHVPGAPVGLGVPYGYRATHVWHAHLSGQSVEDVIVASAGPPVTPLGFHSADIRVLEWDPLAHQWSVAFDAQKVQPNVAFSDPGSSNASPGLNYANNSPAPLLDPKADVSLGSVRFVQLLPGKRTQLAFDASMSYGGSGSPGVLAVVDFKDGLANVAYTWNGEGLRGWLVADRVLHAHAAYWTPTDAHCCAVAQYRFAVAGRKYGVDETSDSRPWLGVVVHSKNLTGPLTVTGFADKAPAAGHLHVGDVILGVLNAPKTPRGFSATTYSTFDKVILLHPGDVARLSVERNGARITVPIRLGSMRDSLGTFLPKTDYTYAAF